MTLPTEFALIARYFRPLAGAGALALSDDAAIIACPAGTHLVLAADALVASVHFLPDDPPETIGRKLLRVNLSDLAAMGARPLGYLLTTAFTRGTAESWIAAFAAGLAEDQARFDLVLLGGDTTVTPGPTVLSLTILGQPATTALLTRHGARPGDDLWVSGTIGDAALGLKILRGELTTAAADDLIRRYRLPEPRLSLGAALAGVAHAGLDVSDGLVQDVGHLCRAAGCGAEIALPALPLSPPARALLAADPTLAEVVLNGGDDYELAFAAAPEDRDAIENCAARAGVAVSRIGRFISGPPAVVVRGADGQPLPLSRQGWSHF